MGWQDRPYYRDSYSSASSPLMWWMTGSLPLFTVFGIRVRIHIWMIIFIVSTLIFSLGSSGLGPRSAATSMAMLFVCVLLHEFGHCFGCRWVGGQADDILMWPLGGLARIRPPHQPWPSFVSTAAGPAVNLVLCVMCLAVLFIVSPVGVSLPWFPFHHGLKVEIPSDVSPLCFYTWWFFAVNYALLMFNLCLVFYPFDGGRIIQELLWWRMGYHRSMLIATSVGMGGAVVVAGLGIAFWSLNLVLIGGFGFYTCYQQRRILRETDPGDYADQTDYSAAYEPATPKRHRRKASQRAINKVRKAEMDARLEQERIDQILAKVSAQGMGSLTWSERRTLRKATAHRRKRDVELSP